MPATLVPKLVPAPAAVRPIQRNQPAATGEKFDVALSEARQANQPIRRNAEPASEPTKSKAAAANKSDKATKNDKPSKARPKDDRDDSAVDPASKASQPETTEKPVGVEPIEDETAFEDNADESALASDDLDTVPTDDADVVIDPALLAGAHAVADHGDDAGISEAEGSEVETADESIARAPMGRLKLADVAEEEPEAVEGEIDPESRDAEPEAAQAGDSAAEGAIDLTELSELAEAEEPAVGAGMAIPAAARNTQAKPAASSRQEVAAIDAAPAQTEDQSTSPDGEAAPDLMMRRPPAMAGSGSAATTTSDDAFAAELSRASDSPSGPAPAATDVVGQKTQTVIEREVVKPGSPSPLRAFVQENHDKIITGVRTQLLPNGGQMQIKLSPGDLGQMQINVRVVDGMLSATFHTTSDDATRLLSHSLTQLKSALETQGVNVDRIQVTQAPREAQAPRGDDGQQQQQRDNPTRQQQQEAMQQEQQRRHLLNRMWRQMADGGDPLDLVA